MSEKRKKYRRIEFYKRADGTKPVADWLRDLDDERAKAIASGLRFFEEYSDPVLPKRLYEKATDHIWEIKVHYGKEQYRLFGFPEGNVVIIAVHGTEKKEAKLKRRDLNLAEDRRKEYMARKESPKNAP